MLSFGTTGHQIFRHRTTALLAALALAFGVIQPSGLSAQTMPFVKKHIYSETANPRVDIAAGLKQAQLEHKRVILDFGGDWCGDCQVLDIYFHQSPNAELLAKHFIVVHIFVDSQIGNNLDLGQKYDVPLQKGVPALAVLSPTGAVLYSQKMGEFENMRKVTAQSVTDFLNHWKS